MKTLRQLAHELTAEATPELQAEFASLAAHADELVGLVRQLNDCTERLKQDRDRAEATARRYRSELAAPRGPAAVTAPPCQCAERIAELEAELTELREEAADAEYLLGRTHTTLRHGAKQWRAKLAEDPARGVERLVAYRGVSSVSRRLGCEPAEVAQMIAGERGLTADQWQQVEWLLVEAVLNEGPVHVLSSREGQGS